MAKTKGSSRINEQDQDRRTGRMLDVEAARQRLSMEQLVKLLEVRPLNATAMLLTWRRQRKEPLVEGYYIKWRGPPLAYDHSWVNVTEPELDHVIFHTYLYLLINILLKLLGDHQRP
jgi:hypothetical protein